MRFDSTRSSRWPIAITLALAIACGSATSAPAPEPAGEAERIAEVLALRPGMRVADVGAGDGEWTVELARRVGESGRVYATEVDEDHLEEIRERVGEAGLGNVATIRGDDLDTGLPEGCCDAILLRMVYHHFTDPAAMRASLRRALRPGGLIAVIDLAPQEDWRELPGVPDRGGHGIRAEELVADMTAAGFEVAARYDDWDAEEPDRYCVVFRRPPSAVTTAAR